MQGVARVSRGGAGKPGEPDILGFAAQVGEGAHKQDFLMVTSKSDHGIGDRIPTEQRNFRGQTLSSLLSFKSRGLTGAVTARLPEDFNTPLDLDPGKVGGKKTVEVSIEQGGIFRKQQSKSLAKVTVDFDKPLPPGQLHFTPMNGGKGTKPVGWVNLLLRKSAYRGSQEGRGIENP
jgi:hypothetical protein